MIRAAVVTGGDKIVTCDLCFATLGQADMYALGLTAGASLFGGEVTLVYFHPEYPRSIEHGIAPHVLTEIWREWARLDKGESA